MIFINYYYFDISLTLYLISKQTKMDEQRQQKLIYIMTHASENGYDTTKFNRFLTEQYSK